MEEGTGEKQGEGTRWRRKERQGEGEGEGKERGNVNVEIRDLINTSTVRFCPKFYGFHLGLGNMSKN